VKINRFNKSSSQSDTQSKISEQESTIESISAAIFYNESVAEEFYHDKPVVTSREAPRVSRNANNNAIPRVVTEKPVTDKSVNPVNPINPRAKPGSLEYDLNELQHIIQDRLQWLKSVGSNTEFLENNKHLSNDYVYFADILSKPDRQVAVELFVRAMIEFIAKFNTILSDNPDDKNDLLRLALDVIIYLLLCTDREFIMANQAVFTRITNMNKNYDHFNTTRNLLQIARTGMLEKTAGVKATETLIDQTKQKIFQIESKITKLTTSVERSKRNIGASKAKNRAVGIEEESMIKITEEQEIPNLRIECEKTVNLLTKQKKDLKTLEEEITALTPVFDKAKNTFDSLYGLCLGKFDHSFFMASWWIPEIDQGLYFWDHSRKK
jgi:hypothetical protein